MSTRRSSALVIGLSALMSMALMVSVAVADTAPLPNDAATGSLQLTLLNSASCPSAGDCIAVGSYTDASRYTQGLIETETAGVWSASEVDLSALPIVGINPDAQLESVSCTSVGNCTVVGTYWQAAYRQYGLILVESDGTWTVTEAPIAGLPSLYSAQPNVSLNSVSCPSAGNCVATGAYADSSFHFQGLIETETDGAWTDSDADLSTLPSVAANPQVDLDSVSCSSVGNCAAIGSYVDGDGHTEGLLDTEVNGVWSVSEVDLGQLPSVAGNPVVDLNSISCVANGTCGAGGRYLDGNGVPQGLLLDEVSGTWQPALEASLPSNASSDAEAVDGASLYAVSCWSPGACAAVGSYDATPASAEEGLALTETNGVWNSGLEVGLPSGSATDPSATLGSVACPAVGQCTATGSYTSSDGAVHVLATSQESGWVGDDFGAPISTGADPNISSSVACSGDGYCALAGDGSAAIPTDQEGDTVLSSGGILFQAPAVGEATAQPSGTGASVAWSLPLGQNPVTVDGYTVRANDLTDPARGDETLTASAAATSATIGGLTPGDSYTFTVSASGALGSGAAATSNAVSVLASAPPVTVTVPGTQRPTIVEVITKRQIAASLTKLLAAFGQDSRAGRQLRVSNECAFAYRSLETGRTRIDWYETVGHGRHMRKVLVAAGSARTKGAGVVSLEVHLSAIGRRLVAAGDRE
jgi:hypothetical protein